MVSGTSGSASAPANGLPSASGANEAIRYGSFDLATARQVAHHLGAQQLPVGYPGGFPQMMAALGG